MMNCMMFFLKKINKIEEINKKFNLEMTSHEKFELLLKLQKKDKVMKTINITYLIKRLLSDYDNSKAEKIELHLCEKMLNFYD